MPLKTINKKRTNIYALKTILTATVRFKVAPCGAIMCVHVVFPPQHTIYRKKKAVV